MFATSVSPEDVSTRDFAGRWFFCDDGWFGTLTLATVGDHDLSGTFSSDRFDEDFRVTARVGMPGEPHAIQLDIHDFNWMPAQHYVGRIFTRSRGMIAGSSEWQNIPFGFFASRATRPPLGTYRAGVVRGEDFAGSWTAYLDGEPATIALEFDPESATLRGSCTSGPTAYEVIGNPGGTASHEISLSLYAPDDGTVAATLSGYLMSRPKNAICGTITVADARRGFVLVRYA
ncbi:hypothetical protein IU479_26990 [Nocardia abscessus]|uniref:hypothetical protein n=1 Tax=Nocardia abscessus TaxID=120957 RepID=UPI00189492CC|nr:hypothetical protein [Nocardia abscessus]MBF6221747.1 hypothetical protein [Nocardia abscessus]